MMRAMFARLFFAAALGLLACVGGTATFDALGDGQPAVPGGHVSVYLDWDESGSPPVEGARVWTSDLGYVISLDRAYLTSYRVEFTACDEGGEDTTDGASVIGLIDRVLGWFSPASAYAGHGSGEYNPAQTLQPMVEDLIAPEARNMGLVPLEEDRYCSVHYLVGRAEAYSLDLPEEIQMVGLSLYLEGTYRAPGSEEELSWVISSSRADGWVLGLSVDPEVGPSSITLSRNLDGLFDGLDFVNLSQAEQERAILHNLVTSVHLK